MKKLFHIFLMTITILSCSYQVLRSQSTDTIKKINYFTWVKSMDKSYTKAVYLTEIKDSSISIMEKKDFKTKSIMIEDIDKLHFRKSNRGSKGFLYGALAGFGSGLILGIISGNDPPGTVSLSRDQKGIFYGIAFTLPGALIGGIIGSSKVNVPINGNQKNYNSQRTKLEKYKYK